MVPRIVIRDEDGRIVINVEGETVYRFYQWMCSCIRVFKRPLTREDLLKVIDYNLAEGIVKQYGSIDKYVEHCLREKSIECTFLKRPCLFRDLYPEHKEVIVG